MSAGSVTRPATARYLRPLIEGNCRGAASFKAVHSYYTPAGSTPAATGRPTRLTQTDRPELTGPNFQSLVPAADRVLVF